MTATSRPLRAAVAASAAGKSVEMVTLVLLATLVPRQLGPDAYGRFAVPLTIVTLGSLAITLGGPTLMARFVPAAPIEQRVALARAIGARLARGRAVQLAVIAAATAVAVATAPDRFAPLDATLVLAALALNVATTLALQMTLGLGRAGPWSLRYPLQNAVLIGAVLVLEPLAGDSGAILAILVSALAGFAFAGFVAAPTVTAAVTAVEVPTGAIRFGAFQAAGAAFVQFSQRAGVLAVAVLAGSAAETGFTALAVGIALGATYAILQAFTVSLPHLADGQATASPTAAIPGPTAIPASTAVPASTAIPAAEAVLRRLAGGLLLALVPAMAVAALTLDRVVPAVFGTDYAGAVPAFGPALAVVVLAPLNALVVQASALRLRPEASLQGGIAAAATFLAVAGLAVPPLGAEGGVLATLAGAAAGSLAALRVLPGAAGWVSVVSFGGAAAVLALALAS